MSVTKISAVLVGFLVATSAFAETMTGPDYQEGYIYSRTPLRKLADPERREVLKLTSKVMQDLIKENFGEMPLVGQVTSVINAKTLGRFEELAPEINENIEKVERVAHIDQERAASPADFIPSTFIAAIGGTWDFTLPMIGKKVGDLLKKVPAVAGGGAYVLIFVQPYRLDKLNIATGVTESTYDWDWQIEVAPSMNIGRADKFSPGRYRVGFGAVWRDLDFRNFPNKLVSGMIRFQANKMIGKLPAHMETSAKVGLILNITQPLKANPFFIWFPVDFGMVSEHAVDFHASFGAMYPVFSWIKNVFNTVRNWNTKADDNGTIRIPAPPLAPAEGSSPAPVDEVPDNQQGGSPSFTFDGRELQPVSSKSTVGR